MYMHIRQADWAAKGAVEPLHPVHMYGVSLAYSQIEAFVHRLSSGRKVG